MCVENKGATSLSKINSYLRLRFKTRNKNASRNGSKNKVPTENLKVVDLTHYLIESNHLEHACAGR